MNAHTVGSKYELVQDLDITDIAKLIRQDIREQLPALKASVRVERYSMGQSINIEAKTQVPLYVTGREMTTAGRALKDKLSAIVEAYNYDDSDMMTDYFNVNFYSHIRLIEA